MSDIPAMDEMDSEAKQTLADFNTQAGEEIFAMLNVLGQTLNQLLECSNMEALIMRTLSGDTEGISDEEKKSTGIGAHVMFVMGTLIGVLDDIRYAPHIDVRDSLMVEAYMHSLLGPAYNRDEDLYARIKEMYGFDVGRLTMLGAMGHIIEKSGMVGYAISTTAALIGGDPE